MTEIWTVLEEGDADGLKRLLDRCPELVDAPLNTNPWRISPDPAYTHQTRPIHFCSFAGREDLLAVLLKYDPQVDVFTYEDNKGMTTPLVLAAWEGALRSCELLLESGANPHIWASAENPLYTAAEHHAWDKVALLLSFGAVHDVFTASICGEPAVVERQIEAYPPLLLRRSLKRDRTPMEEAVEHRRDEVIDLLKKWAVNR